MLSLSVNTIEELSPIISTLEMDKINPNILGSPHNAYENTL